jgi:mono/diheme cytochrome c family protein
MHRFSLFWLLPWVAHSAIYSAEVDFVRDVRPILAEHCFTCHGAKKQKSGLRLDVKANAFSGGDLHGPSIVPGNSGESPLLRLVTSDNRDSRMPPSGAGLSASEIATLTNWIDQGASWPAGVDPVVVDDPADHWCFRPLAEVVGNPSIDGFITEKLAEQGLTMSPPAERSVWLRRVTFDLTGLPPTPEELAEFVGDPRPDAFSRVVDRLLDSERYGERWAQHWLDVIRWAETVGFETNAERPNAWRYRDWVIRSLNEDKPYNRFVLEQIAGDTVSEDAALGFLVAGPANLPGQIGRDEAAMRVARQDELDEVIRTVSESLLGLTIGCARCHDHKFDPISQRDYYSMQAIFAGLTYGDRRQRGPENDEWNAKLPALQAELANLRADLAALRTKHQLRQPLADVQTETFAPVFATAIRMRIEGTENGSPASLYEFEVWSTDSEPSNVALASGGAIPTASSFALANQSRHFDNLIDGSVDQRQAYPWIAAQHGPAWFRIDFPRPVSIDSVNWHRGSSTPVNYVIEVLSPGLEEWVEVAHTRDRLPREDDRRTVAELNLDALTKEDTQVILDRTAAIRNVEGQFHRLSAGPQVYAALFSPATESTFLLHRGDAMQRREQVPPAIPSVLGDLGLAVDAPEVERRLALAQHLTQPDHPLTARVIVNRVWHHHFGTGLVKTPSDFGNMGASPSHPQLLDWLAAKFIADGWSLKKLHRLILTSRAYCQASKPRSEALAIDADARLLWRYPPRRLEAEAIRDAILSVSGKLNLQMGGPGFDFFNQRGGLSDYLPKEEFDEPGWRRMIYAHKVRMIAVDVFGAFDCPDAGQMSPTRTQSITPVQSLGLMNSPFANRQASLLAERVRNEAGMDPGAQLDRIFLLAYSRLPEPAERAQLIALATEHDISQVCRVIFNTSEFAFLQ